MDGFASRHPKDYALEYAHSQIKGEHMQYPKCRILIADDHPPIRHTLRNLLTRYDDIEIIGEAGDGKQAIELVADCRPDLILMDSNMPKMSGIEATSVIRKSWKNTMIIGLCVDQNPYTTDAFLKAGALAVMSKDRFDHLHPTIQRACANRAAHSV
jgi:DNA-binding NarL/FixJ family response regulator